MNKSFEFSYESCTELVVGSVQGLFVKGQNWQLHKLPKTIDRSRTAKYYSSASSIN